MNDTPDIPGSLTSSVQEKMGGRTRPAEKLPGSADDLPIYLAKHAPRWSLQQTLSLKTRPV